MISALVRLAPALLVCATGAAGAQNQTADAVCRLRAATFESVAQERDKGVSKESVVKAAYARMPRLRNTEFHEWVDLVYSKQGKLWSPKGIGAVILETCLKDMKG